MTPIVTLPPMVTENIQKVAGLLVVSIKPGFFRADSGHHEAFGSSPAEAIAALEVELMRIEAEKGANQ